MQKIIARMRGGLGNQLFILACAYYVKSLCKGSSEIVLDTREYETYKVRNFELMDIVNDPSLRLFNNKIDRSLKYDLSRKLFHIIQKFVKSNNPVNNVLSNFGFVYSKRSAAGIEHKIFLDDVYLYGYFQDSRMASKVKKILLNQLDLVNSVFTLDQDTVYIGVSIRWGEDYIKQGWPICSERFFVEGVKEIIAEKYVNKKVCILVFSDEIKKTEKINFGVEKKIIKGLSAANQLRLMSKCSDYVMSNSSFSWWGAFIGSKDTSVVIFPDIWYDTKQPTSESLLYFSNVRFRGI